MKRNVNVGAGTVVFESSSVGDDGGTKRTVDEATAVAPSINLVEAKERKKERKKERD